MSCAEYLLQRAAVGDFFHVLDELTVTPYELWDVRQDVEEGKRHFMNIGLHDGHIIVIVQPNPVFAADDTSLDEWLAVWKEYQVRGWRFPTKRIIAPNLLGVFHQLKNHWA